MPIIAITNEWQFHSEVALHHRYPALRSVIRPEFFEKNNLMDGTDDDFPGPHATPGVPTRKKVVF